MSEFTSVDVPAATGNEPVIQAYRFALDPTPDQERALRSHCGAQRVAYNWGLAMVRANWEQRDAEATYGIPDDVRTPPLNWSAYALRKLWNQHKEQVAPWWRENSKESYASGLANIAVALRNWSAFRGGTRSGAVVGFPRYKSKKSPLSCRFTTGGFGVVGARCHHVRLPSIGVVRTHESTRKLVRRIERGVARLRSVTVVFRGGRWFASFSVDNQRTDPRPRWSDLEIGVDVGIRHLAVLSRPVAGVSDESGAVANGRYLERQLRNLRRLERQAGRRKGADRRTRHPGSARWHRTRARIDRLHRRVVNVRRDGLHKLTSALTDRFGIIVVENLNIVGMLRNRRLSRVISDASWGELRRQLDYKTRWRGSELQVADRWFPSSKTCGRCGAVKTKLRLSERDFSCDRCGYLVDRDVNAARNLAGLARMRQVGSTSSSRCGATLNEPDGKPCKSKPVGSGYRHGNSPPGENVAGEIA